jgi:pimeloyl-ACP methyl ester carboxylesterase
MIQDKNIRIEERAEVARQILFGTSSTLTPVEMRLDDISDATVKTQPALPIPPVEVWSGGGTAPMLVIQGLEDVLAPPENGRDLLQRYAARVTLVEFPHLGHRMAMVRPDLVGEAIVTWTASLASMSASGK